MKPCVSSKTKKKQLMELKNEVKEFHTLLESLLPKLPRITDVDYTHGPMEKGADFIVTRIDDTLNSTEYIGIIAKIGKITKSLTNIYDQIDDCNQPRFMQGGKKKIRLDEIWIITNDSISNNAQEKIYEKYSTRKIKFLQNKDLIKLIDSHLDHYWSCQILPVSDYLVGMRKQIEEENTAQSLMPTSVQKLHIDLKLTPIETNYKKRNKAPKKYNLIDLVKKQTVVVIEGGPGAGKSHLIRKTIEELSSLENFPKYKYVPIYISYIDLYKNHKSCIANLLAEPTYKDLKNKMPSDASLILFIDGFDELILDSRDVYKEVKALIDESAKIKNLRIVITTRPLSIIDYKEIIPNKMPAYEIEPLSMSQVIEFFKKICENVSISSRLIEDIKKSDLFRQMPRNPISAILLAQIINDNAQDLPSNLTDVYSKYSELMLGRWDVDKGLLSNQAFETSVSIIIRIAKYFIENDLTYIAEEEARQFFKNYLSKRNININSDVLFERVTSRSGIIQLDCNYNRVYFKHRSFAEFFYAKYMNLTREERFIDNKIYSISWRTIYFFYLGLIKDCEVLINKIQSIKPTDSDERFWRFANMGDYLLAAYATPYHVIERTLAIMINEAQELYRDITENRVDSPLSDLPEIFVLEFFQAVTCSCYAFRFFEKAMDSAVLHIGSDNDMDDEAKAYSLFFLSGLYRALGKDNPFDGLIEKFERKLPFVLKLGIYYESKLVKHHSSLLKRNVKKLRQQMKKSPELSQYSQRLHELPISRKKPNKATNR